MSPHVLEVEDLHRSFGSGSSAVSVLRGVTFSIAEGEVVGLLGGNGAGKTTLTKIVSTLLLPTSGAVRVLGHDVTKDVHEVRRVTTAVFGGDRGLYPRLTARQNIEFFMALNGAGRSGLRQRATRALTEAGLGEAADRPVQTFSSGMKQRLHLALGLAASPRLLLLDEPTVGLDPTEAERIRAVVAKLRDIGTTVMLTSHYLLDIERLADRVLLLRNGIVDKDMTVDAFARLGGHRASVRVTGVGTPPHEADLSAGPLHVVEISQNGPAWTVDLRMPDWGVESFGAISRLTASCTVTDIDVQPSRLEDAYSELTDR